MIKDADYDVTGGNVFADLDTDRPDEMLAKAKLALMILQAIEERGLTQHQAATLLATNRTNISKLKRGSELRKFTFDRLLGWLTRLDRDVTLSVRTKSRRHVSGQVEVV